ncbi:MAG: hypothetical protein IT310_12905 [Anaerolineales bacterium]|nr:hypothetical protein [Anaerolineales bacterium]MCZ2122724.1 hypothetical protein [Anaerolineales bacterium]
MSSRIISGLLIWVWLFTSCSSQANPQEPSIISWDDLQIAPKPSENLCAKINPEDLDWEQFKRDFPSYGLFNAIEPEEYPNRKNLADGTQWVNPNKTLTFNWRFWYPEGNESPITLRLFVLLNERQLNNALPDAGNYSDIKIESGDDVTIKVIVPPLSPGVHDLIAVGIPYPQTDPDIYGSVIVVARRITLIAGETPSPPFRKINFVTLPAEGTVERNDPGMVLELTLKENGIDVWNWPNPWLDTKTDASIIFFALLGHLDVVNADMPDLKALKTSFSSLLLFLDYQQIEIAPGKFVIYSRTDSNTAYGRIPMTLPPLSEGKHTLLTLRIDAPGVPMCLLWNEGGRILPNSVYGKLVGINAVP